MRRIFFLIILLIAISLTDSVLAIDDDAEARTTDQAFLDAARHGDITAVERLLQARPSIINARLPAQFKSDAGYDMRGGLHWAADRGDVAMMSLLIERDAEIDIEDAFGHTPLHMAGNAEVATLLLDAGAEVAVLGNGEDQPIHTVRSAGVAAVLIARGADPGVRGNHGQAPLHRAVEIRDLEFVEMLIDRGVDIEPEDVHGLTPLYNAASHGNLPIVLRLVENGAEVDVVGIHDEPLCWEVVRNGHVDMLKYMQKQGVGIDQEPDRFGWTLLHNAAVWHRASMIEYLIELGMDVDAKTERGQTPLHLSAKCSIGSSEDYMESVRTLIRAGAEVNAVDGRGQTPLAIAMSEIPYQSVQGTPRDTELHEKYIDEMNRVRQQVVQVLRDVGGKP